MKTLKYFLPSAIILGFLAFATTIYANPFYAGLDAKSATATSTQVYLTPGTATSTVIYDSYELYGTNQTNGGDTTIPDTVAILLQGAASSTATVVSVACEFSNNYTGGNGDWYQNEIYPATTTGAQSITTPLSFSFTYASTTVGGAAVLSNTNRFQKVVTCPAPTRFVRAVVSVTGANASIWTDIVPKKQRR